MSPNQQTMFAGHRVTWGYICDIKSTNHVTDSNQDAYYDGFAVVSSSRHLNGFSIQIDGLLKNIWK